MMVRVQKTLSTDIEIAKEAYKAYVRKCGIFERKNVEIHLLSSGIIHSLNKLFWVSVK